MKMKNKLFVVVAVLLSATAFSQNSTGVAINTDGSDAHSSAMLDVQSTTLGFLAPRMTMAEKDAIISPADGLLVYQTNLEKGFYFYDASSQAWVPMGGNFSPWSITGNNIHYTEGSVGIGTLTPVAGLDVDGSFIFSGGSGDVDGNGLVDNVDAVQIFNYYIGNLDFTREQRAKADVNADGIINMTDAIIVLTEFITNENEKVRKNARNSIGIYDFGDLDVIGDETFQLRGRLQLTQQTSPVSNSPDLLYNIGGKLHFNGEMISSPWSLTGNNNTDPADNFIGTIDSVPLAFRTRNLERMRFSPEGLLGIGLTNPTAIVDIKAPDAGSGKDAITALSVIGGRGGYGDHPEAGGAGSDIILTAGQGGSSIGSPIGRGGNITLTGGKGGFKPNDNFGEAGNVILRGGPPHYEIGDLYFGNVILADIGGKVGIGTDNPWNKLHLVAVYDPLRIEGLQTSTQNEMLVIASNGVVSKRNINTGLNWLLSGNAIFDPVDHFIGTTNNMPLAFRTNNIEHIRILADGKVGIGNYNPSVMLDVSGQIKASNYIGTAELLVSEGFEGSYSAVKGSRSEFRGSLAFYADMGPMGAGVIGSNTGSYGYLGYKQGDDEDGINSAVYGLAISPFAYSGYFTGGNLYIQQNLGLGTEEPSQQLELTGSIEMGNTTWSNTGVIFKNGDRFLHNYGGEESSHNTFLGRNAGSFSVGGGGSGEGFHNTGLGAYALNSLQWGSDNTAVGVSVLQHTTGGNQNTAVGVSAMQYTTTGSENTALGYAAGRSVSSGLGNTLIGYYAGSNLTSGSNNIAIGNSATLPSNTGDHQVVIGSAGLFYGNLSLERIGLGTTNPTEKLEVYGNIKSTSFIGQWAGNTINVDKGGTGQTTLASGKVLVGNGTSGVLSPSNLHWDNTNSRLGIGASNPSNQLHVNGTNPLRLEGLQTSTENEVLVVNASGVVSKRNLGSSAYWTSLGNSGTNPASNFIGTTDNIALAFRTNNIEHIRLMPDGNVGIGISTPLAKLHIESFQQENSVAIKSFIITGPDARGIESTAVIESAGGDAYAGYFHGINAGDQTTSAYGIYGKASGVTFFPNYGVYGTAAGSTTNNWAGYFDEGDVHIKNNLGLGTEEPSQQLELTGSIEMSNTTWSNTGVIFKNGDRFLHNYGGEATSHNTFLGRNAGSFSVGGGGSGEGFHNTGLGAYALNSLQWGSDNTAVGVSVLQNTAGGNQNTAVGVSAMQYTTTGSENTALGYAAGRSVSSGLGNTLIGYYAGSNLTSGSNNIAIGNSATLPSNTGDHQVVIGSAGLFYGNLNLERIGLGTTTPTEKLEVNGNIKSTSFIGQWAGNTISVSKGGTGQTTLASGKVLVGNGTSGVVSPSNLHWDNTNSRLGIGASNPSNQLHVNGTNPLRLEGLQTSTDNEVLVVNASGVVTKRNIGSGTQWSVVGNSGTNTTSNFIGTTDNQSLVFRSNNTEVMRITPQKNVAIGTTTPGSINALHVYKEIGEPYTSDICAIYANTSHWDMNGVNTGIKTEAISAHAQLYGTQTTYGIYSSAQHTNYDDEPWGHAYGIFASAKGGQTNWAGYFEDGDVYIKNRLGIGIATPAARLHVGGDLIVNSQITGLGNLSVSGMSWNTQSGTLTLNPEGPKAEDGTKILLHNLSGGYPISLENNSNKFAITQTGGSPMVGIGVSNPIANLDVLNTTGDAGVHYAIRARFGTASQYCYGVHADLNGNNSDVNIALYGSASTGTINNWAGYFAAGNVYMQNNLGIGIESPQAKLHVNGSIRGQHQSSDGTPGFTGSRSWRVQEEGSSAYYIHTVTVKDGLIVDWQVILDGRE
jgi:hypothetical protein